MEVIGSPLSVALQCPSDRSWNCFPLQWYFRNDRQYVSAGVPLEQFVVERNDGFEAAGVTLATCPSEQLTVDALGLVILGQDDVQTSGLPHRGMEVDVGAAAGHVGRNGDLARLPGLGDHFG